MSVIVVRFIFLPFFGVFVKLQNCQCLPIRQFNFDEWGKMIFAIVSEKKNFFCSKTPSCQKEVNNGYMREHHTFKCNFDFTCGRQSSKLELNERVWSTTVLETFSTERCIYVCCQSQNELNDDVNLRIERLNIDVSYCTTFYWEFFKGLKFIINRTTEIGGM